MPNPALHSLSRSRVWWRGDLVQPKWWATGKAEDLIDRFRQAPWACPEFTFGNENRLALHVDQDACLAVIVVG